VGTSVPVEPRWAPDSSPAEQALWRWAVEGLDDRVLVVPQVAMTVGDGGRAREAEADLVLLDPGHGITVVEVKGGTISYDAGRGVWRRAEAGAAEVRDPVTQVKRTRSVLRDALATAGVEVDRVALRWVVATPECRLQAPGEPVLAERRLWDALAAEQLDRLYRSACGRLELGEQPLGDEAAERIAQLLRGRSRAGRAVAVAAVEQHEAQVRVHTESHRNVLRRFSAHRFVLVRGAAGTGKTVLAVESAAQFASLGHRVLLGCWNLVLAGWLVGALRSRLEELGSPAAAEVTTDPSGQVVVSHVGALTGRWGAPPEGVDAQAWYLEQLPSGLSPRDTGGEFDVVVLDEAQDLSELWVLAISQLVAREGRWYAFADGQQDLFDADAALPDFLELEHELHDNFRNSRQIAAFAGGFGDVELDCVSGDGPPVRFVAVPGEHVVARTREVARKLQRDERVVDGDLAVLWLFHNPFKGANDEVARAIYAAATRARSLLVVVGDPDTVAHLGFHDLADRLRGSGSPGR